MALNQSKIRIIGGKWRSRMIVFPNQTDLRPTPDRVRETVFNWLGQDLSGKTCLDLFAGSGVLGFEAASRGAERVVMVESDSKALKVLRENKEKLKAAQVELIMMNVLEFIISDIRRFNVIFLDPPYRLGLLPKLLSLLPPRLVEAGQVYVENSNSLIPGKQWIVWRSGQAGKVYYQLLKLEVNG